MFLISSFRIERNRAAMQDIICMFSSLTSLLFWSKQTLVLQWNYYIRGIPPIGTQPSRSKIASTTALSSRAYQIAEKIDCNV